MPLPLSPCRFYVVDTRPFGFLKQADLARVPHWQDDAFSTEVWLEAALMRPDHPWRVHSAADAELIYIAANFSYMCVANKAFAARFLWSALRQEPRLWRPSNVSGKPAAPKAVSFQ